MIAKQIFLKIWLLSVIGALSILPYAYYLNLLPESLPLIRVVMLNIINAFVIYGLLCWASYMLLCRVSFNPFTHSFFEQLNCTSIAAGIGVGLLISLFNQYLFQDSILASAAVHPPMWAGALASLYGAINEEVLCRLFLLTCIYFILSKFMKKRESYVIWGAIATTALLFGVGHLRGEEI